MACYAAWIFIDDTGVAWALGVAADGKLTLTSVIPTPSNAINAAPLQDIANSAAVVAIFVVKTPTGPYIDTKPVSVPAVGTKIPLSAGGREFWLQISNGRLRGNWKTDPVVDPVIGELYNFDMVNPPVVPPNLPNSGLPSAEPGGWLPHYSQPGGIGTQSFPAQASGSESMITGVPFEQGMGMNTSGCGHWWNNADITFATVACQQSAIIRCPLCGYLIRIITPAELLYTDPGNEHISS